MTTSQIWWRVQWDDLPEFSAENAWSRSWGSDEEPQRGYSCCESAEALAAYFARRGGIADDARIVMFRGNAVAVGPDGEDLVVPVDGSARWFRGSDLPAILDAEDYELKTGEPTAELAAALDSLAR